MNLIVHFPGLEEAKRKMRAPNQLWESPLGSLETPDFIIQLRETGIEIELEEVEGTKNGLLSYKGQHVLLYIKDTRQDRDTLLHDPENSRRFHIADKCSTLERMREGNESSARDLLRCSDSQRFWLERFYDAFGFCVFWATFRDIKSKLCTE